MTAIERTAYPTFKSCPLHQKELDDFYTPTEKEMLFIQKKLRKNSNKKNAISTYEQHYLNTIVLLKSFQRLGYFPALRTVPKNIITHIREHLKIKETLHLGYKHSRILYRHQVIIRTYLNVKPYSRRREKNRRKNSHGVFTNTQLPC